MPAVRRSPGDHFSIKRSCLEFPWQPVRRVEPNLGAAREGSASSTRAGPFSRDPKRSLLSSCRVVRSVQSSRPCRKAHQTCGIEIIPFAK